MFEQLSTRYPSYFCVSHRILKSFDDVTIDFQFCTVNHEYFTEKEMARSNQGKYGPSPAGRSQRGKVAFLKFIFLAMFQSHF